jgi:hypothetical protein
VVLWDREQEWVEMRPSARYALPPRSPRPI